MSRAATPDEKNRVLTALLSAWLAHPRERLGQFLVNAVESEDLFFLDDDKLVRKLNKRI